MLFHQVQLVVAGGKASSQSHSSTYSDRHIALTINLEMKSNHEQMADSLQAPARAAEAHASLLRQRFLLNRHQILFLQNSLLVHRFFILEDT